MMNTNSETRKQPTAEQMQALRSFAAANGRNWKSELNNLWMTGAYNNAVLGGADSACLQQVRNNFGPSWLVRFRLPDPAVQMAEFPGDRPTFKRFISYNRQGKPVSMSVPMESK